MSLTAKQCVAVDSVRWQDLDARGGRRKFIFDDGKKSDVTPIRFVCACEKGHLQDIDWKWVVHRNQACHEPMWVEEKGTSADPADMTIVCGCGQQLSLQTLFSQASSAIAAASDRGCSTEIRTDATRNSSC